MRAFRRLDAGGRIDRTKPVAFTLDGQACKGFAGDTLASALLANDLTLIGRSFKYHRPRGIMSAGVEEPNGLFTLHDGARREANIPGTMVDLVDGLEARTQNAWPSVEFDLMAVNQVAAPFFQSGFYYKTFMGPSKGSWMFYEPFIRRAAGLGEATRAFDPDRYETQHAFADVLVIGSGAAGLAAAVAAGRSGRRVMLVEQDMMLGGGLLSDASLEAWRQARLAEIAALKNVAAKTHTTAVGVYDDNLVVLVERRDHLKPDPAKGQARQVLTMLQAGAIVYATGAIERPLVFANNDRPGVMLASALRAYLHRFALAPAGRTVIATNNDTAYAAAFDLAAAGCEVVVADSRAKAPADLARPGVTVYADTRVVNAHGRAHVQAAVLEGATNATVDCVVLAMSGGWSPAVHLTSHGGIKPRYEAGIAGFVPGGFAPAHHGAGAVLGTFGLNAAIREGAEAGAKAAGGAAAAIEAAPGEDRAYAIEPVWGPKRNGKAFVDFQNDVTAKDIKNAHDEGYHSVEHLKRYTTLGMGTDQGKTSNVNALAEMAELRGLPLEQAGTTTFRPPYTGVALGAIAGRNTEKHFRPTRRSPLHDWHAANGGVFIEAGAWMRAWYYEWAGNTPASAYVKEMELVRRNVGISDVSTLGKIDVQGPDAAEFLNRVYVNGFAKLPVGKARYGVMLNDDGIVLDDGTTTRLSETRFYMTTTTAQAGEVMSWLEFLLQVHWTDLKVHVTSLTDEWGGLAVSGPNARKALELAFPGVDVSDAALPYMGAKEFAFEDAPIRLLRLSFSGELAYEVHTPADFTTALWERFIETGAAIGLKPYGLEALASLRIEKGHVAGLELDHRNTLDDLGLGKMAGKEKDYVGKALRFRPTYQAPERWSLVGLELMEPEKKLRGGAILFAKDDKIEGHGRGYITSVTWSVELGKFIALGLFDGGLKHVGEEIVCAFPLKNELTRAKIVSPHFIDPEGKRLHA
ncbi:MAG TPA: sarcosine oxidase subunit alpha family protein [Dongiaceae bacterium]|nr:sarcosine oxidase subunit alpha family protein [Dongiaceae bacterium]